MDSDSAAPSSTQPAHSMTRATPVSATVLARLQRVKGKETYGKHARIIRCTIDLWSNIEQLMENGAFRESFDALPDRDDEPEHVYTTIENRDYWAYRKIVNLIVPFKEKINQYADEPEQFSFFCQLVWS
ncbi:hypothetical protein EW146_g7686 [Bondarzewia mesenterica]|uniref:Uncharacterized protein n=1 Tax=Bondarzewia mesenterica TaxID=1095465 RepID=A0A4S4LQQ6_9AGAM|nr:hypothetical protein EW146_g7686 [Bondarzewia mesenterica]